MPNPLISVIVPAFNEKESLEELHTRTKEVFSKLDRPFELIFIDDGSTDGTFEFLKSLQSKHPNIVIIRHFKNSGKSLALMQGFNAARGGIAITLDADLQDRPEEIPNFLRKIEEGYDFVNGWRKNRKDTVSKRLVSMLFNSLIRLIFHIKFNDVNCGFKAFTREAYCWIELKGDLHRLIPILIAHKGFRATEIPVIHEDRKYGVSKYKLFRHRGLLDIIALAAGTTTQVRPFHFFCELGVVLWFLAVISLGSWFLGHEFLSLGKQFFLLLVGLWTLSLGTFFPIFGFYMEIQATYFQGTEWRSKLIKESSDLRD
jgi:glycosyltransferase involved in cell wall biosynthesis